MKNKTFTYFVLVAILVLILDRVTKLFALQGQHVKNYGLLFGLFSNLELRWLFIVIIVAVLVFFIYVLNLKEVRKSSSLKLGLFLMIAGLLGNLIDRIFYGFIIDFIGFLGITTFNISDISILVGSIFVLTYIIKSKKSSSV